MKPCVEKLEIREIEKVCFSDDKTHVSVFYTATANVDQFPAAAASIFSARNIGVVTLFGEEQPRYVSVGKIRECCWTKQYLKAIQSIHEKEALYVEYSDCGVYDIIPFDSPKISRFADAVGYTPNALLARARGTALVERKEIALFTLRVKLRVVDDNFLFLDYYNDKRFWTRRSAYY
ncbi:MAG: hypothetical protein LBP26_05620 [Clostridiales bacterium]|jgi:hypothetical protein|nr:hypothetical protein [Clostridiales bacterium]